MTTTNHDDATPDADPERNVGLIGKYRVERIHDPEGKHAECRYFVLDPQHDPIAERALRFYADEARRQGFTALADDLNEWVGTDPIEEVVATLIDFAQWVATNRAYNGSDHEHGQSLYNECLNAVLGQWALDYCEKRCKS